VTRQYKKVDLFFIQDQTVIIDVLLKIKRLTLFHRGTQDQNARNFISEVYASFELQNTVSRR